MTLCRAPRPDDAQRNCLVFHASPAGVTAVTADMAIVREGHRGELHAPRVSLL